jgi:hypothetical protein
MGGIRIIRIIIIRIGRVAVISRVSVVRIKAEAERWSPITATPTAVPTAPASATTTVGVARLSC